MIVWAAIIALVAGALVYVVDWSSALVSLAEIGGVVLLFTLICAAEAFSIPKPQPIDQGQAQPES